MPLDPSLSMSLGNAILVGCCGVYLIWWSVAFNPKFKPSMAPKVILFLVTLALGLVSLVLIIGGIVGAQGSPLISNLLICGLGLGLYVLLLTLTAKALHRQVTTELLLIVGWVVLESCLINTTFTLSSVSLTMAILSECLVVASAAVSLWCYLVYYRLEATKAFFVGMVPLVLLGVVMIAINIIVWV